MLRLALSHNPLKTISWRCAAYNANYVICVFQENPYVMLRQNHQELEGNERYEGFCVDMLKELADILKFKYRIRLVGDGLYGVPGANGSWTGMVGELISRVCKYRRTHRLRCSLQTTMNYHINRIIYTVHVSKPMSWRLSHPPSYSSQLAAFLHVIHSFFQLAFSA